jgi:hypothetical protein
VKSKVPLAIAGIAATPLFFTALMAISLAVEKPSVHHIVEKGRLVPQFGDATGSTEAKIWLLTILFPLGLLATGVASMWLGRRGIVPVALVTVGVAIALRVPLHTWATHHTARFPLGVDNIPRSAGSSDVYLPGEWEANAKKTSEQLGLVMIIIAASSIVVYALLEFRRRRGALKPPPEPPPEVADTVGVVG